MLSKKEYQKSKGITLIALVITIVVMLILAVVTINLTLGENGILKKAKNAALMHKKAEYLQEIELEIANEQTERMLEKKEELFIVSLQKRLQGSDFASQVSVKVYTKKAWVDKAEINLNTVLVVYTVDKYQILIDVDNENNMAKVRQNSFAEKGKECTVSFDSNEGQGNMDSISITQGLGIILPENTFTRQYYKFAGWYENSQGEGERYNPGEIFTVIEDKTLYAKWSQNSITVTYNAGFETTQTMSDTILEKGETDNILANSFERPGYTFAGWKDQDNLTYTNEQEIEASKDLQLTAQWTLAEYSITYNLDGGTVETANPTTYTVETDTFTLNNPTKSAYMFAGWTGSNGSTAQTSVAVEKGTTGTLQFTANWIASEYTAIFHPNGGSGNDIILSGDAQHKISTPNAPTRQGYQFAGWSTKQDATGGYRANCELTLENKSYNYYAIWSENISNASSNSGIIYDSGNQYTTITGGWNFTNVIKSSYYVKGEATSSYIQFTSSAQSAGNDTAYATTDKCISFRNYSKINITMTFKDTSTYYWNYMGTWIGLSGFLDFGNMFYVFEDKGATYNITSTTYTYDISKYEAGKVYVRLWAGNKATVTQNISKIWLSN